MFGSSFHERQQFIHNSNEISRMESNQDMYAQSQEQHDKMEQRLSELSVQNGSVVSGKVARQGLLRQTSNANVESFAHTTSEVNSRSHEANVTKNTPFGHNTDSTSTNNMKNITGLNNLSNQLNINRFK